MIRQMIQSSEKSEKCSYSFYFRREQDQDQDPAQCSGGESSVKALNSDSPGQQQRANLSSKNIWYNIPRDK